RSLCGRAGQVRCLERNREPPHRRCLAALGGRDVSVILPGSSIAVAALRLHALQYGPIDLSLRIELVHGIGGALNETHVVAQAALELPDVQPRHAAARPELSREIAAEARFVSEDREVLPVPLGRALIAP